MKIAISATNPCHMFPLAAELARLGALDCYYSGYPKWKLPVSSGMPLRTHAFRTNIVYGALRFFPRLAAAHTRDLFLWQDREFDRWVSRVLRKCDFVHAMPSQALATFKTARKMGIWTVLNHATGPASEWVKIMRPEYERVGLSLEEVCVYDAEYFEREAGEYALADFHCVASSVVRDQLLRLGIDRERIFLVPYGADSAIFSPPENMTAPGKGVRVLFAGQLGLRKGIRCLLEAFRSAADPEWELHMYGAVLPESEQDLREFRSDSRLRLMGPVSQSRLAEAFRGGSVLVLPSLEEGFGLVVPQALSTGLPCIVSDRVGAKDLIRHRQNGSIFPARDVAALAEELRWWAGQPRCEPVRLAWEKPAELLIYQSRGAMEPFWK